MSHAPETSTQRLTIAHYLVLVLVLLPALGVLLVLVLFVLFYERLYTTPLQQDGVVLDLKGIEYALHAFQLKHQRYPSMEEGLRVLVDEQMLPELRPDPWGRPYAYNAGTEQFGPRVWTLGADGLPGGEGGNTDFFLSLAVERSSPGGISKPPK